MNWSNCKAVERNPKKMSGAWIFQNTRIPISTFFLNIRDGATVDDFLEWFPGVTRTQIDEVLTFVALEEGEKAA
ncbi:MAG: hypothetical protein ACI8UO_004196 [Verrucomicrobiales bacterium]|jgi:uncharacterized protein (DUF433 family)